MSCTANMTRFLVESSLKAAATSKVPGVSVRHLKGLADAVAGWAPRVHIHLRPVGKALQE